MVEKAMIIGLLGCILCMFGFVALFTYPPKTEKKPMTMDEVKCNVILDAIEKTGKNLRVTFNYRYAPHNSKIRELIMNDAIGYVVPDNDYTMGDPANHYHELISLGQYVASSLMNGLQELKAEIDAR